MASMIGELTHIDVYPICLSVFEKYSIKTPFLKKNTYILYAYPYLRYTPLKYLLLKKKYVHPLCLFVFEIYTFKIPFVQTYHYRRDYWWWSAFDTHLQTSIDAIAAAW